MSGETNKTTNRATSRATSMIVVETTTKMTKVCKFNL